MKIRTETEQKIVGIFRAFCDVMAQTDLRVATAVPFAIGAVTMLYGIGAEFHGQQELIKDGGFVALDAYKAAMQANAITSVREYTELAFRGALPSFGGNAQGIGVAVAYLGPLAAGAGVMLARGFQAGREYLQGVLTNARTIGLAKLMGSMDWGWNVSPDSGVRAAGSEKFQKVLDGLQKLAAADARVAGSLWDQHAPADFYRPPFLAPAVEVSGDSNPASPEERSLLVRKAGAFSLS